jgi:NhaP-type Na+/H+ or K+/H+ antiporter
MQAWVAQYAWPLAFFLNGYLAAILAGVLIGALGTYFQHVMEQRKKRSRD